MRKVEVLVLRHAMAASVAITFDMLHTANRLLVAKGQPPIFSVWSTGSGARRQPSYARRLDASPDIVIIPSLGFTSEEAIVAGLARHDVADVRERLVMHAAGDAEIAASCSAVFLLAEAGLLNQRRATTSWWLGPIFKRRFRAVSLDTDAVVVSDGRFLTAGAAMAQADLMLTLISRHAGSELADACARYMLLDDRRSQMPYEALQLLASTDERVARAEAWARPRLVETITVEQLADAAGMTSKSFARCVERVTGFTPIRFLQRMRVEAATQLVQSTQLSMEDIARKVGYADASTLQRLLKREGRSARMLRASAKDSRLPAPVRDESARLRTADSLA